MWRLCPGAVVPAAAAWSRPESGAPDPRARSDVPGGAGLRVRTRRFDRSYVPPPRTGRRGRTRTAAHGEPRFAPLSPEGTRAATRRTPAPGAPGRAAAERPDSLLGRERCTCHDTNPNYTPKPATPRASPTHRHHRRIHSVAGVASSSSTPRRKPICDLNCDR